MLKINIVWNIGDFWLSVYTYICIYYINVLNLPGSSQRTPEISCLGICEVVAIGPFLSSFGTPETISVWSFHLNHGQKQEQPRWVVLCKRGTTKSWASTWYVLGGMLDHHDKLCQFCWFIWCKRRYSAIMPKTTDQTPQDPASAFKARLVLHSYRLLRWSWCYLLAGGPSPSWAGKVWFLSGSWSLLILYMNPSLGKL